MIQYFKRLGRQTLIYGMGDMAVKAIAFVLIPLYTRRLATEMYGVYSILQTIQMMLVLILGLGLNSAIFKVYNESKDPSEQNDTISTALLFFLLWGVPVTLLLVSVASPVSGLIFGGAETVGYLRLIFIAVFFDLFRLMILSLLRAWEKPVFYSVLNVVHFTLLVTLNVVYVAVLDRGIQGIVESQCIASVTLFSALGVVVLRRIKYRFSLEKLKALLRFGLPLVPSGVAAWSLSMTGQYFLHFYHSNHEVGLYGLGWRFGMILNMLLVHPFRTAWLPFMFSVQHDEKAKRIYSLTLTYFFAAGMFLFLFLSILSKEIVVIAADSPYYDGYVIIPFIAAAYLFYGLFYVADVGVLLSGKTQYYAIITAIGAGLQIGLYFYLVPRFGMMGAAVGTTASYVSLLLMMGVVSQRLYPIHYESVRLIKIVIAGVLLLISGLALDIHSLALCILVKCVLISCYPLLLWLFRFFTPQEIAIAGRVLKNRPRMQKT